MTREMKIGLLLSLGFVIVICVLLSDHVVSATDARPALVTQAGPQVSEGLATPGMAESSAGEQAPLANNNVAPTQTVMTGQEMVARTAEGTSVIAVGPAQSGNGTTTIVAEQNRPDGPSVMQLGGPTLDPAVRAEFVPVGPVSNNNVGIGALAPAQPEAATTPKVQEYKAQPGDTVSRMARKFYGIDSKANCDLIIKANRTLKADPAKITVGKTYFIPAKPTAAAPVAAVPVVAASVAPSTQPTASLVALGGAATEVETQPAERTYVVKSGDNLWRIATEQCKDANAISEIRKLNRDLLKNGEALKIGTKLRLPAK